jgi:hypothetical protein
MGSALRRMLRRDSIILYNVGGHDEGSDSDTDFHTGPTPNLMALTRPTSILRYARATLYHRLPSLAFRYPGDFGSDLHGPQHFWQAAPD